MLPPPDTFGLPAKYTGWRPGQDDAVLRALESPKRVMGAVLPTGFGKSLMYMAVGHLSDARTVVLTSTRALQHQLMGDFGDMDSTTLVQGQRSYVCDAMLPSGHLYPVFGRDRSGVMVTVDAAPCHAGVDCFLKASGCGYYDTVRKALRSKRIITNYAWWFTLVNRPDIKLQPDLLVCDEAHEAPSALADALGGSARRQDVYDFFGTTDLGKIPATADGWDADHWSQWCRRALTLLNQMLEGTEARTRDALVRLRRARHLALALARVAAIDPELLLVSNEDDAHGSSVRFDVVWAAPYAEAWLFRNIPKVLMTSATFAPHTAELLGVVPNDLEMFEAGDGFPVRRRPIYILTSPTVPKVDHRMTPDAERLWIAEMDRVIAARPDRKGIVHCVSYKKRDMLLTRSSQRERMMSHDRHNTADRIEVFKQAKPGTVLVSPSVTTGYDFPYSECEFQILGKVPFPDSRDPVTKARTHIDSRYPAYLAMQEIVQAVGRGMRAADDQCETFLVDKHFSWFLSKHADLAPRWFRRAVRRADVAPEPPPPLGATRT